MRKENDMFLNQLNNQDFTAFDFQSVGLNADNTSLESKDTYKNLDYVKNNPLLQSNGVFDEKKFDLLYTIAQNNYNQIERNAVSEEIGKHANFFRDNFYAPLEQRNSQKPEFTIYRTPNPSRNSIGLVRNEIIENTQSVREIAQSMKVWDYTNKRWIDSPDDQGIFSDFSKTLVLAQWDEDGEHEDPFTGQMVKHKKGDKKLNNEGTYYYETLGGRSVYGREVLSKWDTLGKEGSVIDNILGNDQKESNIGTTLLRDAIKIVPAFIPGVNTWYIGARVAMAIAEMASVGGQIITDNQSNLMNNLNGYFKSLDYSSSDSEMTNAWSITNLINMGADVFLQLAEQRWLFRYGASLFKGKEGSKLLSGNLKEAEEARNAFIKNITDKRKLNNRELMEQLTSGGINAKRLFTMPQAIKATDMAYAQNALSNYIEGYQNIGKYISMAYMTGITVQDSYGEAIQEGASRLEAALLTLGYAIGEFAIINSDLGKWILPELKGKNQTWIQIGKTLQKEGLSEVSAGVKNTTDKRKLAKWAENIIGFGKKQALSRYKRLDDGTLRLATSAMIANALGEGVEETAEELLYDLSKTTANFLYTLSGSDTKLTTWDNVPSRYALSFVGGVIGGGLGQARSEFRNAAQLTSMSEQEAYNKLVDIVRNHEEDEFLQVINKVTWAPKNLSIVKQDNDIYDVILNENGNYKPLENGEISQNDFVKQTLVNEVNLIKTLLNSEGADLSDDAMVSRLKDIDIKRDLRAIDIKNSTILKGYINSYHKTVNDLVRKKRDLYNLTQQPTDSEQRKAENDESYKQKVNQLTSDIKDLQKELQSYFDGTKSIEFMKKALFEMSWVSKYFQNTSLANFLENKYQKQIDNLSKEEIKKGQEEYFQQLETNGIEFYNTLYSIFDRASKRSSEIITKFNDLYFNPNSVIGGLSEYVKNLSETITRSNSEKITEAVEGIYNDTTIQVNIRPDLQFLSLLTQKYSKNPEIQKIIDSVKDESNPITTASQYHNKIVQIAVKLFNDDQVVNDFINEIKSTPYINVAVKQQLENILSSLNEKIDNSNIKKVLLEIQDRPYSPILEFLDFLNEDTEIRNHQAIKLSELIRTLEERIISFGNSDNVKEFGFGVNEEENILNAINYDYGILELAKAVIEASSTNSSDYGDMFGYNVTVNEIDKNSNLATIDSKTANTIIQEIDDIKLRLQYYKTIIDVNSANKLNQHSKMDVQLNSILFTTFKRLFVDIDNYPPEEFAKVSELKNEINNSDNFTILKKLQSEELKNVPKDKLIDFNKEVKQFRELIHDFFEANKSIFENDTEENVKLLSKLLDPEITGINNLDKDILNLDSKNISNSSFVWYLASLAAIDPSKYYSSYTKVLNDTSGDFKLLPIAGQELDTMIAFAQITNPKVFGIFAKAFNKANENYAITLNDSDYRKYYRNNILEYIGKDSDISINFLRTILIEGIAGSGKSNGVARAIIRMLAANEDTKKLLKNVWIVHTSSKNAENFAENLFGDNYKEFVSMFLSHRELMQKISSTNEKTNRKWDERFDSNGNLVVDKQDLIIENGIEKYNFGINKSIEKPGLIITDEVSHLSNLSLRMIDEFTDWAGVTHLTFGDFDQSGIYGIQKDGSVTTEYYAHNTNFIHTPKLGQSLRTENQLKDLNNILIQQEKSKLESNQPLSKKIDLLYYEDDNTSLIGDKIYNVENPNIGEDSLENQIKKLLDFIVDNYSNEEKLGYIYDEKSNDRDVTKQVTEILERLNQEEKYKNRIDFKKGNSSQGFENLYYIINIQDFVLDGTSLKDGGTQILKDFYTGFTRAKRGSLVIVTETQSVAKELTNEYSILTNTTGQFTISDTEKQNFINTKYNIYKDVYGELENESLPYKKWESEKLDPNLIQDQEKIQIGTFVSKDDEVYEVIDFKDEKVFLKNIKTGNIIEVDLNEFKNYTQTNNPKNIGEIRKLNNDNLNPQQDIDNSNPEILETMAHTFNARETGLQSDGKFGEWAEFRYDNIIGIAKYLGIDVSKQLDSTAVKKLTDVLQEIRSILIHEGVDSTTSEQDIILEINKVLTNYNRSKALPENVSVRTIYKISQSYEWLEQDLLNNQKNNSNGTPFYNGSKNKAKYIKPTNELVDRIVDDTEQKQESVNATISIIIYDNQGNELFEIPIATDTNPFTLAFTKDFGDDGNGNNITTKAKEIRDSKKDFMSCLNDLENALRNTNLKNHPQTKKLLEYIRVYKATYNLPQGGQIKFLKNSKGEWLLPSRDWETTGIIVNTDYAESIVNPNIRVEYQEKPVSYLKLKSSGQFVLSKEVYMSKYDQIIHQANGRTITIKAGNPFVLASSYTHKRKNATDLNLYKALWDSENNIKDCDVTIIYVDPPTKPFDDYVKHLYSIWGKKHKTSNIEIYDKAIGTSTTSYRVISELLKHKDWLQNRMKQFYPANSDNEIEKDIKTLESLIQQFQSTEQEGSKNLIKALDATPLSVNPQVIETIIKTKEDLPRMVTTFGPQSNYIALFDKIIVSLTLGYSDISGDKYIKFNTPSNPKAVSTMNDMFDTCLKDYFKYGFFTHVGYSKDDSVKEISYDGQFIIKSALKAKDTFCNGTLVTPAFKIKGDEAKIYQEQRTEIRTFSDNSANKRQSYVDSDLYEDTSNKQQLLNKVLRNKSISESDINKFLSNLISQNVYITADIIKFIKDNKITNSDDLIKKLENLKGVISKTINEQTVVFTIDYLNNNSNKPINIVDVDENLIITSSAGSKFKIENLSLNNDGTIKTFDISGPIKDGFQGNLDEIDKWDIDIVQTELTEAFNNKKSIEERLNATLSIIYKQNEKQLLDQKIVTLNITEYIANPNQFVDIITSIKAQKNVSRAINKVLKEIPNHNINVKNFLTYIYNKLNPLNDQQNSCTI